MTRLFLCFWNLAATFRIWSSGKKNLYLKYVSTLFLILAIELHLVRFGPGASFTFELHCSLPSTPSLLFLFRFTYKQVFLRHFRDPILVPRFENWVPRISENYHQVPRLREIGSLQVHTGYLTFCFKKPSK